MYAIIETVQLTVGDDENSATGTVATAILEDIFSDYTDLDRLALLTLTIDSNVKNVICLRACLHLPKIVIERRVVGETDWMRTTSALVVSMEKIDAQPDRFDSDEAQREIESLHAAQKGG